MGIFIIYHIAGFLSPEGHFVKFFLVSKVLDSISLYLSITLISINSLHAEIFFHYFCWLLIFLFKINFFENFFQEYHQSVKQFKTRSGPTKILSGLISGSKLFVKVIMQRMTKDITWQIKSYNCL